MLVTKRAITAALKLTLISLLNSCAQQETNDQTTSQFYQKGIPTAEQVEALDVKPEDAFTKDETTVDEKTLYPDDVLISGKFKAADLEDAFETVLDHEKNQVGMSLLLSFEQSTNLSDSHAPLTATYLSSNNNDNTEKLFQLTDSEGIIEDTQILLAPGETKTLNVKILVREGGDKLPKIKIKNDDIKVEVEENLAIIRKEEKIANPDNLVAYLDFRDPRPKDALSNVDLQTGKGKTKPKYSKKAFLGQGGHVFDGIDDYMELSSHRRIDRGKRSNSKTILVAFETSNDIDNRQILFEQGGNGRGLSLYIQDGWLYTGGWNLIDDDNGKTTPWGPRCITKSIKENTPYLAALEYDAETGFLKMYLNGKPIESIDVGSLYSHASGVGIGAINQSSFFHDGTSMEGGAFFNGTLGLLAYYDNKFPEERHKKFFRELNDEFKFNATRVSLTSPQNFHKEGEKQKVKIVAKISGKKPKSDVHLKIKYSGTIDKNTDVVSESMLKQITIPAGSRKEKFKIEFLDDDIAEDTETLITEITKAKGATIAQSKLQIKVYDDEKWSPFGEKLALWLDPNIEVSPGKNLKTWQDQSPANVEVAQKDKKKRPQFVKNAFGEESGVFFDGSSALHIANSEGLNLAPFYTEKTITIVFRTSDDVSSPQVIYEQGASARGLNFIIMNEKLYLNPFNISDNDFGLTTPWQNQHLETRISPNTTYVARLVLDSIGKYTAAYINGVLVGEKYAAGRLFRHAGKIGLGAIRGRSRSPFGELIKSGDAPFKGTIGMVISQNEVIDDIIANQNDEYLLRRFTEPAKNPQDTDDDNPPSKGFAAFTELYEIVKEMEGWVLRAKEDGKQPLFECGGDGTCRTRYQSGNEVRNRVPDKFFSTKHGVNTTGLRWHFQAWDRAFYLVAGACDEDVFYLLSVTSFSYGGARLPEFESHQVLNRQDDNEKWDNIHWNWECS